MLSDGGLKHVFIKLRSGWRAFSDKAKDHYGDAMSYVGGGLGNIGQLAAAQSANLGGSGMVTSSSTIYAGGGMGTMYGASVLNRTNITIDRVENGFVVTIESKAYICETAQDVSDKILAHMVTERMEKKK
jgi:hypothetical protein